MLPPPFPHLHSLFPPAPSLLSFLLRCLVLVLVLVFAAVVVVFLSLLLRLLSRPRPRPRPVRPLHPIRPRPRPSCLLPGPSCIPDLGFQCRVGGARDLFLIKFLNFNFQVQTAVTVLSR